jgi:hypothetical protein
MKNFKYLCLFLASSSIFSQDEDVNTTKTIFARVGENLKPHLIGKRPYEEVKNLNLSDKKIIIMPILSKGPKEQFSLYDGTNEPFNNSIETLVLTRGTKAISNEEKKCFSLDQQEGQQESQRKIVKQIVDQFDTMLRVLKNKNLKTIWISNLSVENVDTKSNSLIVSELINKIKNTITVKNLIFSNSRNLLKYLSLHFINTQNIFIFGNNERIFRNNKGQNDIFEKFEHIFLSSSAKLSKISFKEKYGYDTKCRSITLTNLMEYSKDDFKYKEFFKDCTKLPNLKLIIFERKKPYDLKKKHSRQIKSLKEKGINVAIAKTIDHPILNMQVPNDTHMQDYYRKYFGENNSTYEPESEIFPSNDIFITNNAPSSNLIKVSRTKRSNITIINNTPSSNSINTDDDIVHHAAEILLNLAKGSNNPLQSSSNSSFSSNNLTKKQEKESISNKRKRKNNDVNENEEENKNKNKKKKFNIDDLFSQEGSSEEKNN